MEILRSAVRLLGERTTWEIVFLSFRVSLTATLFSFLAALPFSLFLAGRRKKGKFVISFLQTFLFIPSVTLGLILYLALSRRGFLGFLNLLYTPKAMVLGQAILIFPLITVFLVNGLKDVSRKVRDTLLTLGASLFQYNTALIREAKFCLISAFIIGLSRAIGETGLAMVVGGNIKGETRVITTSIALYTMRGDFEIAVALGLILLATAFFLNLSFQTVEQKWR